MGPPSPNLAELARRIIEEEAGGPPDAAASAAALDSACGRLKRHLADLLGSGGVSALLTRALYLSQRDQPLLAEVTLKGEPGPCYTSLAESLAGVSDEEALAAVTSLLTHILGLLVMLLGENLGMKPISKLWPQVTSARENEV